MFKVENNAKIGEYLGELIDQKFKSRRSFCKAYIRATGEEATNEQINNMSNRLSQIIKGNKAIQTYDLPYFSELLDISCEQLLSAGEYYVPLGNRVTNYSIASSKDPAEWQKYIDHTDKLILNCDEYGKTVLDYALEFRNYDFIKYLMDHNYIWFDSRKDKDYVHTFGAGTSIRPRDIDRTDNYLQNQLATEDELRINLITLAADNEDMEMLMNLRARENPQLYFKAHYIFGSHPDFDSFYDERMVKHISTSSENILDYFTDPFEIRDNVKYKDNSKRAHTFMFPYISELLDMLIRSKSPFAETAIKKALKHNQKTYQRLRELILSIKNDEYYSTEHTKSLWVDASKECFDFYENGKIVMFFDIYSSHQLDGIITNVARTTESPSSPILKHLVNELNQSYLDIVNMKEKLEEI